MNLLNRQILGFIQEYNLLNPYRYPIYNQIMFNSFNSKNGEELIK